MNSSFLNNNKKYLILKDYWFIKIESWRIIIKKVNKKDEKINKIKLNIKK